MNPSSQEILRSYRRLYRRALQAVQYSSPARYTLRTLIRRTYRTGSAADFDNRKIENTLIFLSGAARETGLEHRIVKNLLHTWWWDDGGRLMADHFMRPVIKNETAQSISNHFEITLKMLNETMGLCLPTRWILRAELLDDVPATNASTAPATKTEDLKETRTEGIQVRYLEMP